MLHTLQPDLHKLCDEQPFHTGWYLKNLRTGETLQRHGDVVVPSASTRKIAIMMTTLQAVHAGKFADNDHHDQGIAQLDGKIRLKVLKAA